MHLDCRLKRSETTPGLLDLLQMLRVSVVPYVVKLAAGSVRGEIVIYRGDLYQVCFGDLSGERALAAILALEEVVIRAGPTTPPTERHFDRSFDQVILDLIRKDDERRRIEGKAPLRSAPTWIPEESIRDWVAGGHGVVHVGLFERVGLALLAADNLAVWNELADSPFVRGLLAPFFESSPEVEGSGRVQNPLRPSELEASAVVGSWRYVVDGRDCADILVMAVFEADISLGLARAQISGLRRWLEDFPPPVSGAALSSAFQTRRPSDFPRRTTSTVRPS